jgi:hypothetical protein
MTANSAATKNALASRNASVTNTTVMIARLPDPETG